MKKGNLLRPEIIFYLLKIYSFAILILILNAIFVFFGIYGKIKWIDMPMHFFGGVIIAIAHFLFLKMLQREGYIGRMHNYVFFLFVISFVALTAVSWEFFEYALDIINPVISRQPSLRDTMGDLFLGLVGGILGYVSVFYVKKK